MAGFEGRRVILRKRTDGTPVEAAGSPEGDLYVLLQAGGADVDDGNPLPVQEQNAWTTTVVTDATADDSDKVLAVPANTEWQLLNIYVTYVASGDAGDRQLVVQVRDTLNNVIAEMRTGLVQAASVTRYYLFAPGCADLAAFRDTDFLMTPMPPTWILSADFDVRIFDNNAIAAAADDMTVRMLVATRSA